VVDCPTVVPGYQRLVPFSLTSLPASRCGASPSSDRTVTFRVATLIANVPDGDDAGVATRAGMVPR
jgi:hypothetical protein